MSENKQENIIKNLRALIERFATNHKPKFDLFKSTLNRYLENVSKLEDSFSGSWIGFHALMYFRNFEKPDLGEMFNIEWGSINGIKPGWEQRSYEDITDYVEVEKLKLNDIQKNLDQTIEKAEDLKTNISTELSFIKGVDALKNESDVLDKIEQIQWGSNAQSFIDALKPGSMMSRDRLAVSQGLKIPPHIRYQAGVMSALSTISSIEDFIKMSTKLIRQVEIQQNLQGSKSDAKDAIEKVREICNRFHLVIRQLQNRYDNRPTLVVDDEYDVQDLLHALLKLDFDDIRPEEWSPSYCGGASRMDHLLKTSQIVIESKKTRKGLGPKEIGDQLIIDIAKYKKHPECKILICFVYDPEARIGNPRGLENDLMELSTDEMNVLVIIRPQ